VGLKSNLEYQPDIGLEEVTDVTRARRWIHTYVRGDADLLIGHVDVLRNELLAMEVCKMSDIIPDGHW
jgi:hypothetical protein